MLSGAHFYHRITRKVVVAFGTIFNNIRLVRYNKAGTTEIERINVPLSYMPKEKFFQRINQDPDLLRETGINLPRMVFELTGITYDPLRKTSMFNQQFANDPTNGNSLKGIRSAPYNFDFTLSIYVRNTEDGTQIVEQILPYFSPDYTISVALTDLPTVKTDIPIVLNSIQSNNADTTGSPDEIRIINWDLTFTAKATLYGPISDRKIVRNSYANTFYFNTDSVGIKVLNLNSGTGSFKVGELVYEGPSLQGANGTGFVESWDPVSNNLILVDISGNIKAGKKLHGAVTGAAWNIASYDTANYKMESIQVQPNPPTANANDDFGFTTTITDFI
jgi:hypothetical protein